IDIAGDFVFTAAQRHLTQHQGPFGIRLQCRQDVANPAGSRRVELVDEDHVRDVVAVEEAQERADRHRAVYFGLADHGDDNGGLRHWASASPSIPSRPLRSASDGSRYGPMVASVGIEGNRNLAAASPGSGRKSGRILQPLWRGPAFAGTPARRLRQGATGAV